MSLGSLTCCLTTLTFIVAYGSRIRNIENNSLIIKAIDKFGVKLYQRASNSAENVLICPLSVHFLLSTMFVNNYYGNILHESQNTFGLILNEDMYKKYINLVMDLKETKRFTVVNSISRAENFTPIDVTNKVVAVTLISVSRKKKKNFNRYSSNVNDENASQHNTMLIDNNISFNGKWQSQFSKYSTTTKTFVTASKLYHVEMMSMESYFNYGRIPDVKAAFVKIPFQDTGIYMLVVLPDDINGLEEVEKSLETVTIKQIMGYSHFQHVDLELPKFQVTFETNLKQILRQMNVEIIYTDNLYRRDGLRCNMVHITSIEIGEGGTEDGNENYSFVPYSLSTGVSFKANHPFHYKIVKETDNNEDYALFIGNIKKL